VWELGVLWEGGGCAYREIVAQEEKALTPELSATQAISQFKQPRGILDIQQAWNNQLIRKLNILQLCVVF